jgi:peptide/nickel transport system permease protein
MAVDPAALPSPSGLAPVPAGRSARRSLLREALRTTRGRVGGALVAFVVVLAAIGPAITPESPTALVGPPFASPGDGHPLGLDQLGRDVLSRLLAGGWQVLLMAGIATAIGVVVGAWVGIVAAYRSGLTDSVLMRVVDVLLAFPQLVFALLIVSVVGAKDWLIVLAVAIGHIPQVARVIRSAALDVSERDFVRAVELMAVPGRKVMRGEILSNLTSPLMVETGLRLTWSIIIIAGLSFLGFGLEPPTPSWGNMINENRVGLASNPWAVIGPSAVLALLTVGMNTLTDAIARVSVGVERYESPTTAQIAPQGLQTDD